MIKNNCCVITPLSPILSKRESDSIGEEIAYNTKLKTGLDMSYVQDCTIDFIEEIKKHKEISLFNINSDIFAILISMNLDKTLKLFVSEIDFLSGKHQLLNRKFCVL